MDKTPGSVAPGTGDQTEMNPPFSIRTTNPQESIRGVRWTFFNLNISWEMCQELLQESPVVKF